MSRPLGSRPLEDAAVRLPVFRPLTTWGELRRHVERHIYDRAGVKWCSLHDVPAQHGPDPFLQEIRGNDRHYWLCEECRYSSSRDI